MRSEISTPCPLIPAPFPLHKNKIGRVFRFAGKFLEFFNKKGDRWEVQSSECRVQSAESRMQSTKLANQPLPFDKISKMKKPYYHLIFLTKQPK